jgi:predicted transcriptional regulator
MLDLDKFRNLLKQASLPEPAKELVSDLLGGFVEALDLTEKQARELETKDEEIKRLKEANSQVELQKVASTDAFKEAAEKIAEELVYQDLLAEKNKSDMVDAVTKNPEKVANVVQNIFSSMTPATGEGEGVDTNTNFNKEASENGQEYISADDPMMDIIRKGAA